MTMRPLITFVSTLAVSALTLTVASATAQQGDALLLRGEEQWLQTNPLDPYFEAHPGLRPQSDIISTGLWRGYVASWEIADGRLVLTDVRILRQKQAVDEFDTELYSVMSTVFPGEPPVIAEWFTGYLISPSGKLVEYVHMGYASTYEKYSVITVEKGIVKAEESMTEGQFRRFREAQFSAYKKTEEYAKAFTDLKKENDTIEEIESFLFEYSGARYMSIIFDESIRH